MRITIRYGIGVRLPANVHANNTSRDQPNEVTTTGRLTLSITEGSIEYSLPPFETRLRTTSSTTCQSRPTQIGNFKATVAFGCQRKIKVQSTKSPPQGLQHLIKKSGYKRHTPTPPGLRVSVPDSSNTPPQSDIRHHLGMRH